MKKNIVSILGVGVGLTLIYLCTTKRKKDKEKLTLCSTVSLRSGIKMPLFGLGTWLSEEKDNECFDACKWALDYGYKLIDTAALYKNEQQVGAAIQAFKGKHPFVVTKIDQAMHGKAAMKSINQSLEKLQLDQIDLVLIHTPKPGKMIETWDTLIEAKKQGKVKAIGVSNFGVGQLIGLRAAGREEPEVNQFEYHCWNQQKEMVEYCKKRNIAVMGYCPLARCKMFGKTQLKEVAQQLGKTEAQICCRWAMQKGVITIPKSSKQSRIIENAVFDFELSEEQMRIIDTLDEGFKASNACKSMDLPWVDVK